MDDLLIRRREMMQSAPASAWDMLIHNSFNLYTFYKTTNGNTFTVMDNGEWVEVVSNGKNDNGSSFFNSHRYVYEDIKDKLCRLTWEIECSDPTAFTTDNGAGNITFGLFTVQNQTSQQTGSYRKSKVDYATLQKGNYLGYHQEEFVPSQVMAGQTVANYFGWNIGFRSAVNGLTIHILRLDFEVHR